MRQVVATGLWPVRQLRGRTPHSGVATGDAQRQPLQQERNIEKVINN